MTRTFKAVATMLALTPAFAWGADPWLLCPAWPAPLHEAGADAHLDPVDAPLRIEADFWETLLDGDTEFSGSVVLRQGPRTFTADRMQHNRDAGTLQAEGQIRYSDTNLDIESRLARIESNPDRVRFDDLDYRLHHRRGRGSAASLEAGSDQTITMRDVHFTTCPATDESWGLHASRIELDTEAGVGIARGVRVEFKGVPIFYSPWLSFPLDNRRKTGFLIPDIGRTRNIGLEARAPFYWNIAPNQDATLTPRWMQDRGIQLISEYRYLFSHSSGIWDIEVLPDDRVRSEARFMTRWRHGTTLTPEWNLNVDFNYASDPEYFEDLAGSLDATVVTHLRREAFISYQGNIHTFVGRVDGWQTLDRVIPVDDRPYARLPQLLWHVRLPIGMRGPIAAMRSEVVAFEAESSRITGLRMDVNPDISWPMTGAGWHFIPSAGWRYTSYRLDNLLPPFTEESPSRSIPRVSIDTGLVFERELSRQRVQSLEPRLLWLRIPYRDQEEFPLFDSSIPDFNLVQLYHLNRFNGADRVGDTNHLAIGLTSRIHSPASGKDLLVLQVGRIRYFDDRRVQLPGDPVETEQWSDIFVEANAALSENWSARMDFQIDPNSNRFERSLVQFRWHPDEERLLNVGWRFRRGQVDQSDVSFAWPLAERWRVVGRWNWSIEDRTNLETFAGLEYQSCCWAVRFVSRQYIANRAGDTNRSFYIQLELKGLASVGRGTEALLQRGILGYPSRR